MSRKQRETLARMDTAPPATTDASLISLMFNEAVRRHQAGDAPAIPG